MARSNSRPDTTFKNFTLAVSYDDTHTRVRIFTDEPYYGVTPVAEGVARRTKGDKRDPEIGLALATGRAFEALAKREFSFADQKLNPVPVEEVVSLNIDIPEWLKGAFGGSDAT